MNNYNNMGGILSADILFKNGKRVRDAAFFLIIMLVTFAATL